MSPHATRLLLVLTSLSTAEEETPEKLVDEVLEEHRQRLVEITTKFRLQEISPASAYEFEKEVAEAMREMSRQLVERTYNSLEPEQAEQMPHDVHYEAGGYRRRNDKTRNAHVATLFGSIELRRYAYRYWHGRDGNEPCIFPLEMQLGLVQGATPALAEAATRYLGSSD
jgi:type III secretory pathway component EscV